MWRQFSRLAEYEDLRDLYKRCIPEISKFESKILDFQFEIDKCCLVIRKLDEAIMLKAEKASLNTLYEYIDNNKQVYDAANGFDQNSKSQIEQNSKSIKEMKEMMKQEVDLLKKEITLQIHHATFNLKDSYFDE